MAGAKKNNPRPKKAARAAKSRNLVPGPPLAEPVHRIMRAKYVGPLTFTATDKGWNSNYALGDMPGYTEFSNLFKYYRAVRSQHTWTLIADSPSTSAFCVIYVMHGQIGAGAPSAIDDILQGQYKSHVLTPARPTFTYSQTWPVYTATTDSAIKGLWSTTADTNQTYLGPAYWIQNGNTTVDALVTVVEKVWWEFNGTK
jgi:hypothetical protein